MMPRKFQRLFALFSGLEGVRGELTSIARAYAAKQISSDQMIDRIIDFGWDATTIYDGMRWSMGLAKKSLVASGADPEGLAVASSEVTYGLLDAFERQCGSVPDHLGLRETFRAVAKAERETSPASAGPRLRATAHWCCNFSDSAFERESKYEARSRFNGDLWRANWLVLSDAVSGLDRLSSSDPVEFGKEEFYAAIGVAAMVALRLFTVSTEAATAYLASRVFPPATGAHLKRCCSALNNANSAAKATLLSVAEAPCFKGNDVMSQEGLGQAITKLRAAVGAWERYVEAVDTAGRGGLYGPNSAVVQSTVQTASLALLTLQLAVEVAKAQRIAGRGPPPTALPLPTGNGRASCGRRSEAPKFEQAPVRVQSTRNKSTRRQRAKKVVTRALAPHVNVEALLIRLERTMPEDRAAFVRQRKPREQDALGYWVRKHVAPQVGRQQVTVEPEDWHFAAIGLALHPNFFSDLDRGRAKALRVYCDWSKSRGFFGEIRSGGKAIFELRWGDDIRVFVSGSLQEDKWTALAAIRALHEHEKYRDTLVKAGVAELR